MKLHELLPAPGATHSRKRVGRGHGSGHGTYSGRGIKGQKARTGGTLPPRFEGGQLPLYRRLPFKRGFTNIWKVPAAVVNVGDLDRFPAGSEITPDALIAAGLVKKTGLPVKILGDGEIRAGYTVRAHHFSASARRKIEAAGGTVVVLGDETND